MKSLFCLFLVTMCTTAFTQRVLPGFHHCGTDRAMESHYRNHLPDDDAQVLRNGGDECYVIPVVFHVYGQNQGGYQVNENIIEGALEGLNADYHGLNSDFDLVHQEFLDIRGMLPEIEFVLAQLDPDGNPTNGIVNHPVASGYGNGGGYDDLIAADSWDNYMYMNIYIQHDLYNDGVTNNSGVAWYPDTWMSDNGLARIVYNGAYLGENADWEPEFASTLTHEYGHWLNLRHTFNEGCTYPNDMVDDTPPCDYWWKGYGCHPNNLAQLPMNCEEDLINAENYMDYAGAYGCYRMFTQGQVARMVTALNHPSRFPLWQQENLVAVGLEEYCEPTVSIEELSVLPLSIQPTLSDGRIQLVGVEALSTNFEINIYSTTGQLVHNERRMGGGSCDLSLAHLTSGIYVLNLTGSSQTIRFVIS